MNRAPKQSVLPLAIIAAVTICAGAFLTKSKHESVQPPVTTASDAAAPIHADWKTYTNSEYGLSVQYPPAWNVEATRDESILKIAGPDGSSFVISPLVSYWCDRPNYTAEWGGTETLISDRTACVFVSGHRFAALLHARGDADKADEEAILATLKPQSANWLTYVYFNNAFTIDYPSDAVVDATFPVDEVGSVYFDLRNDDPYAIRTFLRADQIAGGDCNDFPTSGADPTTVKVSGMDFTKISMSKKLSGSSDHYNGEEYCKVIDGVAYKMLAAIKYEPDHRLEVDNNETLNRMIQSFRIK